MAATEKRWLLIFATILLSVTTLPYLIGFWQNGNSWQFSGFFMGVEDGNSYIAKMLLGSEGEWLFKTPYTAFPQNGFLAFLPYLLLGKLASPPGQHAQLTALFQLFRWAGGFVMVYATYLFVSYFIEDLFLRKLGTIVAVIGGGLGWLSLFGLQWLWGGRIPLEYYSPETFGFLSLLTLPHLAMARGLLLLGILMYWKGFRSKTSYKKMLLNGMLWVALGLMQPLTVAVGWMVIGLDIILRLFRGKFSSFSGFIREPGVINGLVMGLCSAPILFYTIISFNVDPFLKIWSAQNIISSPPPGDYLLGYAVLLPFLFIGARKIFLERRIEALVTIVWVVLIPVLAYFPYNLQRRLPEGTWVAIVIAALIGLNSLKPNLKMKGSWLLALSLITPIIIFAGSILAVTQTREPLFQPADAVNAFTFLGDRVTKYPVVLAAYEPSNSLAAWAPVRTVIGHGPESVHLDEVKVQVADFFNPELSDDKRMMIIEQYSIKYILWGPAERQLGSWKPADWSKVTKIYQNTTEQIFEVNQ